MTPPPTPSTIPSQAAVFAAFVELHPTACPTCGAALAPEDFPACRGCGDELVVDLALAEPCTRQIILGTIGLAAGLGFAAVISLISLYRLGVPTLSNMIWLRMLPLYVGTPVLAGALVLWLRRRSRFRRLPVRARSRWVSRCWLLSGAFVALFIVCVIARL